MTGRLCQPLCQPLQYTFSEMDELAMNMSLSTNLIACLVKVPADYSIFSECEAWLIHTTVISL